MMIILPSNVRENGTYLNFRQDLVADGLDIWESLASLCDILCNQPRYEPQVTIYDEMADGLDEVFLTEDLNLCGFSPLGDISAIVLSSGSRKCRPKSASSTSMQNLLVLHIYLKTALYFSKSKSQKVSKKYWWE